MRLLILGGTGWLGRAAVEAALAAGHEVTCVVRGTGTPAGATLVRADRDTDSALAEVALSRWDAVIDVARQPGHVRRAVRDLGPVANRYVFVSTCSVYASQSEIGATEDAALLDPLTADEMTSMEDYGAAKVACEQAVLDGFGAERSAIVRAGLIGGPGDPSGRTSYWALRFDKPSNSEGRVLVPDVPELPTALIDVRDLAAWLVRLAERGECGVFNALGDPVSFAEHVEIARSVAGHIGSTVAVPQEWLIEHGVAEWSGPRSLPLWLADRSWYGMNARSNLRAHAADLQLRSLRETLADSLTWDRDHNTAIAQGAGLTDDEERELLAALDA